MPLVEDPAPIDTAAALERYLLTKSQAQSLWQRSGEEEQPPGVIADRIVEERLALGGRAKAESVRRTKYEDA